MIRVNLMRQTKGAPEPLSVCQTVFNLKGVEDEGTHSNNHSAKRRSGKAYGTLQSMDRSWCSFDGNASEDLE